jgi:NADH:ubiquinone oxidoreductase subunit H
MVNVEKFVAQTIDLYLSVLRLPVLGDLNIEQRLRLMIKIIFIVMERIIRAIIVLIRVAYITLLERKVLSYSQNRIGPNKVIFTGIIQPILDGVKLLFKELLLMYKRNQLIFLLTPYLSILTILLF